MPLPIVAVVGRPNVGKSTFVNRIAEAKEAIVHESSGVTRDRSYHTADWNGREFQLVDTGGVESNLDDRFQAEIRTQVVMAMDEADVIVFLVDGNTGVTTDDQMVARMLQKSEQPVFLCANKLDNPDREDAMWEFMKLGLGEPWPISALHGHGTGDLLDAIVEKLPEDLGEEEDTDISIAIIGRPNSGKSSLTNRLVGKERSIVSDIAGTTRDAIDTIIERDGTRYRIVDTAGIRRKALIDQDVEYYGFVRALRAIERADVALLVVDSTLGLTDQDQRVAELARERGCAMVILLNKWDLMDTDEKRAIINERVEDRLMFVRYAPVIRISALTGRSVDRIWKAVDECFAHASTQIPTNRLNALLADLRDFGHTVVRGTRRLRLNYVTQTGVKPPTFTFFANFPELVDDNFERYLEGKLRENFDLSGTPIRLRFRKKNG